MVWFEKIARHKPLQSDVEGEEARVGLMEPEDDVNESTMRQRQARRETRSKTFAALILSNAAWALLLVLTNWSSLAGRSSALRPIGSTAFVSPNALPESFKTIRFDDELLYNTTSQKVWRKMDPSLPQYFGQPNPEIDAAWAHLLRHEYPQVTSEEIALNPGLKFSEADRYPGIGKYYIALDVFHNLHCLNAIRRQLDKEYYGAHHHGSVPPRSTAASSAFDEAQRDHIDHCMNHIRQALQCRPDLTPAAMHVYTDRDGSQFVLGNAGDHSCYDWDQLLTWAEQRRVSPDSYVEIDG